MRSFVIGFQRKHLSSAANSKQKVKTMNTDRIRQHALSIRDAIEGTVKQMNTIHSEMERHRLLADHLKQLLDIERHFFKVAGIQEVKVEANNDFFQKRFFQKRAEGFNAMSAADTPYDPKAPLVLKDEEAVMPNTPYAPAWKETVVVQGAISKVRELLNMKEDAEFFVQLVPAIEGLMKNIAQLGTEAVRMEDTLRTMCSKLGVDPQDFGAHEDGEEDWVKACDVIVNKITESKNLAEAQADLLVSLEDRINAESTPSVLRRLLSVFDLPNREGENSHDLEDRIVVVARHAMSQADQVPKLTARNKQAGEEYKALIERHARVLGFTGISALELETKIAATWEEVKELRTSSLMLTNWENMFKALAGTFEIKEEEYGNMGELGPNYNKLTELVLSKRANYINQIQSRDNVFEDIKKRLGLAGDIRMMVAFDRIMHLTKMEKNLVQFGVIKSAVGISNSDEFTYGTHQVVEMKDLAIPPPAIGTAVYYMKKG